MRRYTVCMMLGFALLGGACGGCDEDSNNEPMQEPEQDPPMLGERPIMQYGPPDQVENSETVSEYPRDEPDQGTTNDEDQGEACCPVTFAIADENMTEDELEVALAGDGYPFNERLTLSYADGVWSVETCVVPEYDGEYVYIMSYEVEGEIVEEVAANPYAPVNGNPDLPANVWLTSSTCEGSAVEQHAYTSAP